MNPRELESLKIVKKHMWWATGAGLIPFPAVDLVAVSGVQLKMIAAIAKVYEIPYQESQGKMLIGSLLGFAVPSTLSFGMAASVLKSVPVVGTLVGAPSMALFCGASAWALGKVFIQHFESGGTFLTFDPQQVQEYYKKRF